MPHELVRRAGAPTPVVSTFATVFSRHRQRRWRRFAGRLDAVATQAG
ncbi:MAG: hypothetical protein AAGF02_03355 [Actinomycetota bacterium]